jgi:hypothetical protein
LRCWLSCRALQRACPRSWSSCASWSAACLTSAQASPAT